MSVDDYVTETVSEDFRCYFQFVSLVVVSVYYIMNLPFLFCFNIGGPKGRSAMIICGGTVGQHCDGTTQTILSSQLLIHWTQIACHWSLFYRKNSYKWVCTYEHVIVFASDNLSNFILLSLRFWKPTNLLCSLSLVLHFCEVSHGGLDHRILFCRCSGAVDCRFFSGCIFLTFYLFDYRYLFLHVASRMVFAQE